MSSIIPYGRQHVTEDDIAAVRAALESDFLTQGPRVQQFERAFAEYVGAPYAVAVSNGTAALHLAALVLGIKPGQRVITSPITFVASANCVRYCGGDVEFADIDPQTYCLDLKKLEAIIAKSPELYAGVIPVDLAGYPVNLEKLHQIAKRFGLWVLEDACHAPGAAYLGSSGQWHKSGSATHNDLSIFSFHPVKHIACGEGSMITTGNRELYEQLLILRTHGITRETSKMQSPSQGGWYYEQIELGYNYRMPDILCALGVSQLQRAEDGMKRRHEIAQRYSQELRQLDLKLPFLGTDIHHAFHLYIIQTPKRLELYNYLKERGVHCQVHYIPVHQQPYYKGLYGAQSFPVAEDYYRQCLSLPMYPSLTNEQQSKVIQLIKDFHG